jgi:hypothetical protein
MYVNLFAATQSKKKKGLWDYGLYFMQEGQKDIPKEVRFLPTLHEFKL